MEETRIQSVARTLLQICITILPIGAGASSFISSQDRSLPILIALGFVWIALITISYSSFLLLNVLQFERGDPQQTADNKNRFDKSIRIFILGTIFLVISPGGFAFNQIRPPSHLDINISRENLAVTQTKVYPVERVVVLTISNVKNLNINSIKVDVISSDAQCLSVDKANEILPFSNGNTWITSWKITIFPTCPIGDEIVQFNILKEENIVGQLNLIINILP